MGTLRESLRLGTELLRMSKEWISVLEEAASQMEEQDPEETIRKIRAASAAGLAAAKAYLQIMGEPKRPT